MPFILVTADFPAIRPIELQEIFARLECDNWLRMHDHAEYHNTVWFMTLDDNMPLREAIEEARYNFDTCCTPYCKPKLSIECGMDTAARYCKQSSLTLTKYRRPATCEPSMFSIIKNSLSGKKHQPSNCC